MTDILTTVADWIVMAAVAIVGGFVNRLHNRLNAHSDKHDQHERDLKDLELNITRHYSLKSDVEKGFDRIVEKLDLIFEKLEKKVDK